MGCYQQASSGKKRKIKVLILSTLVNFNGVTKGWLCSCFSQCLLWSECLKWNESVSCSAVWLFVTLLDCSPAGSFVHGILQARIPKWVVIPFSRGSSRPRDWTWVSCIAGRFFTFWATREAQLARIQYKIKSLKNKEIKDKRSFPLEKQLPIVQRKDCVLVHCP